LRPCINKYNKFYSYVIDRENTIFRVVQQAQCITEKLLNGEFSSKLPNEIQPVAIRKLRMINNAQIISDLRIPPANRLEKLKGNLKGVYSIRINKQWRIVFQWIRKNADQLKTENYYDQNTKHTPWGSSNRRIS
jgi:proteic killer suppression protein